MESGRASWGERWEREGRGYRGHHTGGVGRHGQKTGGVILPDMMRWLWRGQPVSVDVNDTIERSFRDKH